MAMQEFGFLTEAVADPRLDAVDPLSAPTQAPLTDRETAGFYKAMQEEREKRQALERQLSDLKTASETPAAALAERDLGVTVYANNLRTSRRFAEREYGKEAVSAVHDWAAAKCDSDPSFNARMRASDDPYEAAKQVYDYERALRTSQDLPSIPPPPRSLANAPGNGALGKPHIPVGDGNAYDSLFK